MDIQDVQAALNKLPLGGIRYFPQVGSTNDEAARWVAQNAPNMSLVLTDEQTAGRGRTGRTWIAPAGSALTFSLILHPQQLGPHLLPRLTALGSLAVEETLRNYYDLPAQIKWPNDVLVHRQKICGVLTEAQWDGDQVKALILGIGINVARQSAMEANRVTIDSALPAASLEELLDRPVNRLYLLSKVLDEIIRWQPRLASQDFLQAWEANLAFRGEWVRINLGDSQGKDGLPRSLEGQSPTIEEGKVMGLFQDGSLRLRTAAGEIVKVNVGEIHLRPASQERGITHVR